MQADADESRTHWHLTCRDACLLLLQLCPLQVRFGGGLLHVGLDCLLLLGCSEGVQQGVLRRNDHVGGTEQGVRPGGKDLQGLLSCVPVPSCLAASLCSKLAVNACPEGAQKFSTVAAAQSPIEIVCICEGAGPGEFLGSGPLMPGCQIVLIGWLRALQHKNED